MKNNNNNILLDIKEDIGKLKGKVDGINNRLDRMNGNLNHHDEKIDKLETDCDILQEAFKPIQKAYTKMTSFSFGVIIIIGSVAGGFLYFLWDKIK